MQKQLNTLSKYDLSHKSLLPSIKQHEPEEQKQKPAKLFKKQAANNFGRKRH